MMKTRTIRSVPAAVALITFLVGCGNDPTGLTPYPGAVDPPPPSIPTFSLTVFLDEAVNLNWHLELDQDPVLAPIDDIYWESSDEATVSVLGFGTIKGVGIGTATVSATVEEVVAVFVVRVKERTDPKPPEEWEAIY
jgi:hypothetical protein